jgi:hypothetical protein
VPPHSVCQEASVSHPYRSNSRACQPTAGRQLAVLGNSVYECSATRPPVFRSSTPSLRGPEASGGHPYKPDINERNVVVSLPAPGPAPPAPEKRTSDESPIKNFMALTQLDIGAGFKRRDVRTDDEARPTLGSRRSAQLLVLGPGVTRACPSASSGACDSDGSSPRIFGGGETSRLH